MFVFCAALASTATSVAPVATIGTQEEGVPVTIEIEAPWEIDAESALLRVRVNLENATAPSLVEGIATEPIPTGIYKMMGGVASVEVETHFKACRKDTGLCRPFTAAGEAQADALPAKLVLAEVEDANAFIADFEADKARHDNPKPKGPPPPPGYKEALAADQMAALTAARQRSKKRKVPLLVVAGFDGCAPCGQLARDVLFAEDDPVGLARMEWVLLNQFDPTITDELTALGIQKGAPSFTLRDRKGRELGTSRGYGDLGYFKSWLDEALAN